MDSRFFTRTGPFSLKELAARCGAEWTGEDRMVQDIAPLEAASAEHLSFLDNVKYVDAFRASKAGACFARAKFASLAPHGMAVLVTEQPYTAYAMAAALFYPATLAPFISPQANIYTTATLGEGCRVEAGAWIGAGVVLGNACHIGANVTISHAILGDRVVVHPGAHIGQDGFGFAPSPKGILKVPQLGRVLIGNDVEIGAGTCIDRGAGPDTVIGDFCKIDNMVQIGHNCVLGRGVMVAGMVGLAGSTHIGDYAQIGGQAGTAGHLRIGARARIAAKGGVVGDVPDGETWGGFPAKPIRQWHRETSAISRLAKTPQAE